MAYGLRCYYFGIFKDGSGKIVPSGTVTAYLAGISTLASIYTTVSGTTAVNSITADSTDGSFEFWIDRFDYDTDQKFKIILSKSGYTPQTIDNINIDSVVLGTYTISDDLTVMTDIYVPSGVLFSVASGKTLTLNGIVEAGPYQIFTGDGTVTVGTATLLRWGEWWGTSTTGIGTRGQALTSGGSAAQDTWQGMSTQGDIEYHNGTTRARLGAGTKGQALTTGGASANPSFEGMTTQGDIEYFSTNRTRLSKGTAYQGLRMNSGATIQEWSTIELVQNLKLVINTAVNKLDIFTKSGGAVPDATNVISVAIPDGNGYTFRSRAATYLSGTSQFVMADAANYWSKGSLDAEIKNAYIYAIWDGTGIIWALGGYSGFTRVPASTTVTDGDFFLLEASSTYTKAVTEYCVCVGKIRYQYDTADTPDHTIQATVLDAPQVIWNPKSDYGGTSNLAADATSESNIAAYSAVSVVVKQSGSYMAFAQSMGNSEGGAATTLHCYIKTGSATYASATQRSYQQQQDYYAGDVLVSCSIHAGPVYLNSGDTIHLGAALSGASGTRTLFSGDYTKLSFYRID